MDPQIAVNGKRALRAILRGFHALSGVLTLGSMVTSDSGSTRGQHGG